MPYQLRGAERFFERAEVREAGTALRGAARAGRNDSLLDGAEDLAAQVRAVLSTKGWTTRPPAGSGAVRDRWESLAALVRLAEDFETAKPGATLTDLVRELDERAAAQHAPTVQGVTLASLHAAKGLEWDAVFLVGLTEGMMPIAYARTEEQIEEERRLLYVGVTRARHHLSLSWSLARSPAAGRAAGPPGSSTGSGRAPRRPAPGAGREAAAGSTGGPAAPQGPPSGGARPSSAGPGSRCGAGSAAAPSPTRAR